MSSPSAECCRKRRSSRGVAVVARGASPHYVGTLAVAAPQRLPDAAATDRPVNSATLREGAIMIASSTGLRPWWRAMGSLLTVWAGPWASSAVAQMESMPRPGELVRGRIFEPTTKRIGTECRGAVQSVVRDTIIVSSIDGCPRSAYLADLRVARGSRGSRLIHVGLGILAGGIVGGLVAHNRGAIRCRESGCVGDDQEYVSGIRAMVGAGAGALVGAVVGAAVPAGPRWVKVGAGTPVRVVGFMLRPEVRISLRPREVD